MAVTTLSESTRNYKQQLNALERSHADKIARHTREQEVAQKKMHDAKEQMQIAHDRDLIRLKDEHNQQIMRETEKHSEALAKAQAELKNSLEIVDQERQHIIQNGAERNAMISRNMNNQIEDRKNAMQSSLKNLNDESNLEMQRYQARSEQQLAQMKLDASHKMQIERQKIENREKEAARLDKMNKLYADAQKLRAEKMARNEHAQKLRNQTVRNENELQNRQNMYDVQLNRQKDFYTKRLADEVNRYEETFKNATKFQNEKLTAQAQKFDEELKSNASKNAELKRTIASKQEDAFYHLSKIEPVVTDNVSEYVIKINIAPHERDGLRMTAENRTLKFNLTRQFSEEINDDQGTYKTKRSEILSKTVSVKDIVDPTKITETYDDNVLTIHIAKK